MITLTINKKILSVPDGTSVAAAVLMSDAVRFRKSVSGEPRLPICGIGVCFECRVSINGETHQRSCQLPAKEGMKVETDE